MKQKIIITVLGIMLLSGMCVLENCSVKNRPSGTAADADSSVYVLAGEFRKVAANLLWIKADAYHHEYLEHGKPWTTNKDLMGLFEMITALDPHFVEAYSCGSYIYVCGYHDPTRAVRYLRQGISNNTHAWDLYKTAALFYARQLHDPHTALIYAQHAVSFCDDDQARPHVVSLLKSIERLDREKSK